MSRSDIERPPADTAQAGESWASAPAPSGPSPSGSSAAGRLLGWLPPYAGVVTVWLLLVAALCIFEPNFRTHDNINNILRTSSVAMVLALGVTFTILHGGIDLSVGSLLALTGVLLVGALHHLPEGVAIVTAIAFATAVGGVVNGGLIGSLGLPPFVVTLGTLSAFRGLALVFTNGRTEAIGEYQLVTRLGDGNLGPVPAPVLVMVVVFLLAHCVLRYTYFGRDIYAMGGNEEAARLSGIRIGRVKIIVYAIAGLSAGLAGVMQSGRLAAVSPSVAGGIELYVAAAVLLGGTSLSGGVGGVVGTVIGVLFLGTVQNGLTIVGVSAFWQQVVTGVILVLAVLFDRIRLQLLSSGNLYSKGD